MFPPPAGAMTATLGLTWPLNRSQAQRRERSVQARGGPAYPRSTLLSGSKQVHLASRPTGTKAQKRPYYSTKAPPKRSYPTDVYNGRRSLLTPVLNSTKLVNSVPASMSAGGAPRFNACPLYLCVVQVSGGGVASDAFLGNERARGGISEILAGIPMRFCRLAPPKRKMGRSCDMDM